MRSIVMLLSSSVCFAQQPPAYEVVMSKRIMVPMRDGAKLATGIYRPGRNGVPVEGKFPVILEHTLEQDMEVRGSAVVNYGHRLAPLIRILRQNYWTSPAWRPRP